MDNVQRVIDHCENARFGIGQYSDMTATEDLHSALVAYKEGNRDVVRNLCEYGCPSSHGLDEADELCCDAVWHKFHQEQKPKQNWKIGFPVCEECWKLALKIEV